MMKNDVLDLTINKIEGVLKINRYYSEMLKKENNIETKDFLQKQVDKGKWFKEMIERRGKTLKSFLLMQRSGVIYISWNTL